VKELSSLCVALVVGMVLALAFGCRSTRPDPAAIPSDQMTPVVWNDATRGVLERALDKDSAVLASVLEAQAPEGSVIYINHLGYVYDPAGNVVFDPKSGEPLRIKTTIVAKLNSLKELASLDGVESVDYTVGGRGYLKDLPDGLKHMDTCPTALELHVKGIGKASASSNLAEVVAARAGERERILAGLSALTRERYVGKGKVIEAVAGGLTQVIDMAGTKTVGILQNVNPIVGAGKDVADKLLVAIAPNPAEPEKVSTLEVVPR